MTVVKSRSSEGSYEGLYRLGSTASFPWRAYSIPGDSLTESMVTLSHRRYPEGLGKGDVGGPWLHTRTRLTRVPADPKHVNLRGVAVLRESPAFSWTHTFATTKSDNELNSLGTTGIARTEPTNPSFSAATFLGELREGVPSPSGWNTWRRKTINARAAGDEYLNVEFGWKPLISDIKSFAHAVNESDAILSNYHKASGRTIKRGISLGSSISSRAGQGSFTLQPSSPAMIAQGTIHEITTSRVWFSGAYRYYLPVAPGKLGDIQRYASDARKLLGLEITPEVLWNISPWSWAADWFGNIGDVMHNVSAMGRDGLVLEYGYIMHESRVLTTAHAVYNGVPFSYEREQIVQQRKPATPYGFGVDLKALSARQIAILAALGLSRT